MLLVQSLALAIAAISALVGTFTYRKNSRTKEAEFISQLHRDFFVEKTYKKIRDLLDSGEKSATLKIEELVAAESADFTDFLNFFELAAYFESCDTLSTEAVEATLGYYLNLFENSFQLRKYIKNPDKSFEYLYDYLSKRSGIGKED